MNPRNGFINLKPSMIMGKINQLTVRLQKSYGKLMNLNLNLKIERSETKTV